MKKGVKSLLAAVVFAMMMPFQSFAADENTMVELNAEGNKAGVQITLPENTGKGVTALELRINVNNLANANVGFEFSNVNATVQETRYREDSGELVVYVAGGKQLFSNDTAFLGYVVADSNVEGNVLLDVKENALQVADGIYGIMNHAVEPTKAELKTEGNPAPVEPDSSSSSASESAPSNKSDSSSSNAPASASSNKLASSSSSKPNAAAVPNHTNGSAATANGNSTGSNNKKPSASKAEGQDVADDNLMEESSESSSAASESKADNASASASSSSKFETTVQSTAQKEAGNSVVWVVVAVLGIVAVVAVVVIIRKKK